MKKQKQQYIFNDESIIDIGIDVSVTSPGICIYKKQEDKYYFYFLTQRKREIDFFEDSTHWQIKSIEYPEYDTREERFECISSLIIDILHELQLHDIIYNIGIEGYSYGSTHSQGISSLYELGGVVRNKLHINKYSFIEIPPTVIKKHFTGKGNSSKAIMYEYFKKIDFLPDMYDVLNIKESKNGSIPKPIEDLVDAYAIVSMMQGKMMHKTIDVVGNILKKMNEK